MQQQAPTTQPQSPTTQPQSPTTTQSSQIPTTTQQIPTTQQQPTTAYIINQKPIRIPLPPAQPVDPADQHGYLVAIKAAARDLDFGNQNLLIIYKGTKQWWNIGGRSLLFYQYYLAPECELSRLNPRIDTDFYERWPANPGCASIRNIYNFTQALHAKAGTKLTKLIKDHGLLVFRLDHKFSEEEIRVYLNVHKSENDRTGSILMPQNPFPGTRNACDLFNKALFDKAKNCEAFVRTHLVEEAFASSNWIAFNFIAMSNGHLSPDDYFPTAFRHLNFIQDWFVHIQRYPVLDSHSRSELAEQLVNLRQRLETDYKIIQSRQSQSNQLSDNSQSSKISHQKSDKSQQPKISNQKSNKS